ncbi:methylcrotonoyl-CoA carboxylase subunit alpha, mitochondrial-like isoform X2 [Ornithodoros turicata]|uniref:methylcrotonoyl-CoA carboxylase subunit alpha, mitochondrial-like isoform X2 n=1 Tax=Ornithodoros turicata TaxID=34597 RepID=UPI0031394163
MAAPLRCAGIVYYRRSHNQWHVWHQQCQAASSHSHPRTRIDKILIANRGEIACRVIRSARKLGIRSVAVYSDADSKAMHVAMADEAYRIGPAPSQESYLRRERIIETAKKCGAQAIHPGYGFLSESTEFADMCASSNIVFIGPPASAIRDMGIKSTSKAIMSAAGVPIVEGYHGEDQSYEKLRSEAARIGYPVMVKAVRGGGGKGMRIVMTEADFDSQLESAKREAMKSFGDEAMLIEKFVANPRHVEVQVFGDQHDNYVYLFERDCSVQRRHQKVIEEAPGPGVTEETRRSIGEAAVKAARAVKYVGAGTVEFIMDPDQKFYFMEMNTRLQVEHPITEMITGTDLVEWQIKVASGEPLPLKQDQLRVNGHAFEARIYAEDPDNNFMPGAGNLDYLRTPDPTQVRIDTGVREGDEVSVHYDPMIAKLAVWGPDRLTALRKLHQSLADYTIVGLPNNVPFLMQLASHKDFQEGDVHTEFIPQHKDELFPKHRVDPHVLCASVVSLIAHERASYMENNIEDTMLASRDLQLPFRINSNCKRKFSFTCGKEEYQVMTTYLDYGSYRMECSGETYDVTGRTTMDRGVINVECDVGGSNLKIRSVLHDGTLHVYTRDGCHHMALPIPKYLSASDDLSNSGGDAVAPMPGVIEKVFVKEGDHVAEGDPLIVMIAMKMEYVIKASADGTVEKLLYKIGDNVSKNAHLVKIKSDEPKEA